MVTITFNCGGSIKIKETRAGYVTLYRAWWNEDRLIRTTSLYSIDILSTSIKDISYDPD